MDEKFHYPNKIRFHLVTIVPMAHTPKLTSKLRYALLFNNNKFLYSHISKKHIDKQLTQIT